MEIKARKEAGQAEDANEFFDLPEPPEIDQMKKDELYDIERDGMVVG